MRDDRIVVAVFENGQLYSVRTDHIGRPVFATDSAGNVAWEAAYLPFGGGRHIIRASNTDQLS